MVENHNHPSLTVLGGGGQGSHHSYTEPHPLSHSVAPTHSCCRPQDCRNSFTHSHSQAVPTQMEGGEGFQDKQCSPRQIGRRPTTFWPLDLFAGCRDKGGSKPRRPFLPSKYLSVCSQSVQQVHFQQGTSMQTLVT